MIPEVYFQHDEDSYGLTRKNGVPQKITQAGHLYRDVTNPWDDPGVVSAHMRLVDRRLEIPGGNRTPRQRENITRSNLPFAVHMASEVTKDMNLRTPDGQRVYLHLLRFRQRQHHLGRWMRDMVDADGLVTEETELQFWFDYTHRKVLPIVKSCIVYNSPYAQPYHDKQTPKISVGRTDRRKSKHYLNLLRRACEQGNVIYKLSDSVMPSGPTSPYRVKEILDKINDHGMEAVKPESLVALYRKYSDAWTDDPCDLADSEWSKFRKAVCVEYTDYDYLIFD